MSRATIQRCEQTAPILKLLAHPRRLFVLCILADGEFTVGELEKRSELSQSLLSQFLAKMRSLGLVTSRKEGRFSLYRIADARIEKLIKTMHGIF